jgi:hypothetical protein
MKTLLVLLKKTVNAKDLYFTHNAYYCTGGKAADITHAYNYEQQRAHCRLQLFLMTSLSLWAGLV